MVKTMYVKMLEPWKGRTVEEVGQDLVGGGSQLVYAI
jgi:hypothetical protein